MRKILSIILVSALGLLSAACGENPPAASDYTAIETQFPSSYIILPSPPPDLIPERTSSDGIDLDLTTMSSNIVYTEVYYMAITPDEFTGKVIRMSGAYDCFYDESSDQYYHGCIIQDATACCTQGIEFRLTDDYVFPDDYPSEGDTITVTGTYSSYEENGHIYYTLTDAVLS